VGVRVAGGGLDGTWTEQNNQAKESCVGRERIEERECSRGSGQVFIEAQKAAVGPRAPCLIRGPLNLGVRHHDLDYII
jgi:hypothetical protein